MADIVGKDAVGRTSIQPAVENRVLETLITFDAEAADLEPCKANIARARELIAAPEPETVHVDTTSAAAALIDHRPPCPCCGGRMVIVETFERGGGSRGPPPSEPRVRPGAHPS